MTQMPQSPGRSVCAPGPRICAVADRFTLEVRIMTRSLFPWPRRACGRNPARRGSFVPRVLLLEDRTLPSVQFTPAPYAVPANRPDTALGSMLSAGVVEPYLSVNPA